MNNKDKKKRNRGELLLQRICQFRVFLPYFRIVGGEMHHKMRYKHSFKLTVCFYGECVSACSYQRNT